MRLGTVFAVALACCALAGTCGAAEARETDAWTVVLSGEWEFAAPGASAFKPIRVPGIWRSSPDCPDWKTAAEWKTGTYRREFAVPEGMTGAAVEFDAIAWGGEVLVNGKPAGKCDLGHAPFACDVSALVKPGANVIEVKPVGWPEIERLQDGSPAIPVGAGNWFGGKSGGIPGEVFLRLYKGARVASAQVRPKTQGPSCDLRVEISAGAAAWTGRLSAEIVSDDGKVAVSAVASRPVTLEAGATAWIDVKDVQAPGAKLWWPESPTLYRAVVRLESGGDAPAVASVREETFGFREVACRDGRFLLNGRPVALFGYTGVMFGDFEFMADAARLKTFQVTLFRAMNAAAFRSHQDPLPRKWIDACDRGGALIISEFPNFPDVQLTPIYSLRNPYDSARYWENLRRDAAGIVAERMNHPSIVAWSASNEGCGYGDWERANLVPFVKSVDPTRPVMLSGDVTDDFADTHNFLGNWFGTQADFERVAAELRRFYPRRVLGCSEFAQYGPSVMVYGPKPPAWSTPEVRHDFALLISEETEALRRERFGLIMPYVVPTRGTEQTGRVEDANEPYYAMREAYAPMGVSLDLSRRHAVAGTKLDVPVCVMSDSESASGAVTVEVGIVPGAAAFGPEDGKAETRAPAGATVKAEVKPWEAKRETVSLAMPRAPGEYTVLARLTGRAGNATSRRPLRVYAPLGAPAKPLAVGVIDRDGRIESWLRSRGHRVVLAFGGERPDVIIVGEGMVSDGRLRSWGFDMEERVRRLGTRLVVLEQPAWNATAFAGKLLDGLTVSALQVPVEPLHPDQSLEAKLGTYLDFRRLNGVEGIGLRRRLEPPDAAKPAPTGAVGTGQPDSTVKPAEPAPAPDKSAWKPWIVAYTRGEKKPDWALVSRRVGAGQIYACQVPLAERIDSSRPLEFDPVAERLFALLVEGDDLTPAETPK